MTSVPELFALGDGLEETVTGGGAGDEWIETSHEDNLAALYLSVGIGLGRDPRLARSACLAVYLNIRGHTSDYKLYLSQICRDTGYGKDAVKAALKKLDGFGYLRRKQLRREDGTMGRWVYHTNDAPAGSPQAALMGKLATKLISELTGNPNALTDQQAALLGRLVAAGFAPAAGNLLTSNFQLSTPRGENPAAAPTSNFQLSTPGTENPAAVPTSNFAPAPSSEPGGCYPAAGFTPPLEEEGGEGKEEPEKTQQDQNQNQPRVPTARRAVTPVGNERVGGYAAPKLIPAQRKAVRAELREALGTVLPAEFVPRLPPNLPNTLPDAFAAARAERDPDQIRERIERRWTSLMYDRDFRAGTLGRPIPITMSLIEHTRCRAEGCGRYCPDTRCEDGVQIDNDKPCPRCAEHAAEHRAAGLGVPLPAPAAAGDTPAAEPPPGPGAAASGPPSWFPGEPWDGEEPPPPPAASIAEMRAAVAAAAAALEAALAGANA